MVSAKFNRLPSDRPRRLRSRPWSVKNAMHHRLIALARRKAPPETLSAQSGFPQTNPDIRDNPQLMSYGSPWSQTIKASTPDARPSRKPSFAMQSMPATEAIASTPYCLCMNSKSHEYHQFIKFQWIDRRAHRIVRCPDSPAPSLQERQLRLQNTACAQPRNQQAMHKCNKQSYNDSIKFTLADILTFKK